MPLDSCDFHQAALFFDFDGTLADIAPTPGQARARPRTLACLRELARRGAALAIVSGRSVESIDALLKPLRLAVAGVHGAQRRDGSGRLHRHRGPDLGAATAQVLAFCRDRPGLCCEIKPGALTLHYRQAPAQAAACRRLLRELAAGDPGLACMPARMAVELLPRGVDKARAVSAFLDEPGFRGRLPLYFGDDLADEPAFACVQSRGGMGVKVGAGASVALARLASPAALRAGLVAWLRQRP